MTSSVFSRRFQKLAPRQHHCDSSPDQPVDTHYHGHSPDFPAALLQLSHPYACRRRPHLPQLHPQRPRSSCTGASGMQRCRCHPRHHSGPHREQHLSERAVGRQPRWTPHPPDPRQRVILCLKAVHHHQSANTQSLWCIFHGHGLQVRLCCSSASNLMLRLDILMSLIR